MRPSLLLIGKVEAVLAFATFAGAVLVLATAPPGGTREAAGTAAFGELGVLVADDRVTVGLGIAVPGAARS